MFSEFIKELGITKKKTVAELLSEGISSHSKPTLFWEIKKEKPAIELLSGRVASQVQENLIKALRGTVLEQKTFAESILSLLK